jgi:hypothetical protein
MGLYLIGSRGRHAEMAKALPSGGLDSSWHLAE